MVKALLVFAVVASAQDMPRHHSESLSAGRHQFDITMQGIADGENTRDPVVYNAWKQAFEPMRAVRLENTGFTDVVNPWVLVNGRRDWRTTGSIAAGALREYGDPSRMSAAEKARAIFEYVRLNRFHATTGDFEVRDPVKLLNVYGYALCGDNAHALADLWRAEGFTVRRGFPIGHCVSEAWYDGAWHMFDADESVLFLDRDNRTVVAEKAVAHDHDLARRGYREPMLASLYTYDGGHAGSYPPQAGHTMNFTLRPGEAIEWRWDHRGKHHHAPLPSLYTLARSDLKAWGETAWATLANGRWTFAPPLGNAAANRGATAENIRWTASGAVPAEPSRPASITWKMEVPYPVVGGELSRLRCSGTCTVRLSADGEAWQEAGTGSLDRFFPNQGAAVYRYFVRVDLAPKSKLESFALANDLQMAKLSLPALRLGRNRIAYTDESAGPRSAALTFEWVERTGGTVPAPIQNPEFPKTDAVVSGTRFTLAWPGSAGNEYHIQLGDDPEMRWALTPAFDAVVKEPRFALSREGMLEPGRRYYWRVRARSSDGIWGPWSAIWQFTPEGPGVPLRVRLEPDRPDGYTMRWEANPVGRRPAQYRIYASDEKGFPANDEPFSAPAGNQKQRGLFPGEKTRTFPANFLAAVTGPEYALTPKHAFYRVVAVDAAGNRSGSSEYAAAPRPFVFSEPPRSARLGEPFRYQARTIASIGDLTYRDFGPGQAYQAAYWDADQPVWSLEVELPRCGTFDPKWLTIDPRSGLLSGTPGPGDAGRHQINVKVAIPGAGTFVQSFPLDVGR